MIDSLMEYEDFYKGRHKARKLDWFHSLGTATLAARFPKGEKELSVSLYQAIVLLLFNHDDVISYSELASHTGIGSSSYIRCSKI
jgi:cullin-4